MRKPPEELLELLVPAPFGPPSEQFRYTIARAAFFLTLLQDQRRELDQVIDRWPVRLRNTKTLARWVRREAELQTRRLGCPWPWLVLAVKRYLDMAYLVAQGARIPDPILMRVPESALRALYGDGRRAPKAGGETVAEWARWYYRFRVHGQSVRRLALDYHDAAKHPRDFVACDCRPTVRHALREVARLLQSKDPPPVAPLEN